MVRFTHPTKTGREAKSGSFGEPLHGGIGFVRGGCFGRAKAWLAIDQAGADDARPLINYRDSGRGPDTDCG